MIIVKQKWSQRDILASTEDPGRRKGKPSGSYIDELVSLKKAVILCSNCLHKFNAKKAAYEKPMRFSVVRGKCDDCREFNFGTLFLHTGNERR